MYKIVFIILLVFFSAFIIKSVINISTIPFHDFDEAHRAESAKKMKEYFSFLVPLTGSPADRTESLKIPLRENPNLFLYYHPERPPLVYWLMIASASIFGTSEWVYRLPSYLMALATIIIFITYIFLSRNQTSLLAFYIGLLSLLTSTDLWLSGQYAQLDTSLTFFLFASLLFLIKYCEKKKNVFIAISGLSFSLAVLSKGQPAIIFIFPIIFLYFVKKLSLRDISKFILSAGILLIPWLLLIGIFFNFHEFLKIFTKFAASSAVIEYSHIKAPVYWYLRWWWDSFRPGWSLFLALLSIDFYFKSFNLKKMILLSYIIGGMVLFSLAVNKIWWYVLPLVPAVSFYIYLSVNEYLKNYPLRAVNLSVAVILASIPVFLTSSNKATIIYGIVLTLITFLILIREIKLPQKLSKIFFLLSLSFSLFIFLYNFPKIVPYHRNTKYVAEVYKALPGKKCLYILDMPPETALFYSNAGDILTLTKKRVLLPDCEDYLITPSDITKSESSYYFKGIEYYLRDQKTVFQKGTMKLIKL